MENPKNNNNVSRRDAFALLVLAVFILGTLYACSGDSKQSETEFSKNVDAANAYLEPSKLKPEMIVKAAKDSVSGCITKQKLDELVSHAVKKEKTKFEGMFKSMQCMNIPINQKFKILSVDRHYVEFININSSMTNGLWASDDFFEPI